MRPVDQEFLADNGDVGDCVRAATASVLDLDREEVPHFLREKPGSDWYEDWELFMIEHGVRPIMIHVPWNSPPKPTGYYLASGPSPRGFKHMVVMWDGKLAHDPHPSRAGLVEIEAVWILARV